MSEARFMAITDLHNNLEDADELWATKGESHYRLYSTAQNRLKQFGDAWQLYSPHFGVNLGDVGDGNDSAYTTTMAAHVADVGNYIPSPDADYYHTIGNHDYNNYGSAHDFSVAVDSINGDRALVWPVAETNKVSYIAERADLSDFRLVFLTWCIGLGGTDFDASAHGSTTESQYQWLTKSSGALDTPKKVIVFAHGHLTTSAPLVYAYHGNSTIVGTLQDAFEAAGNVVAVITGHYHKGGRSIDESLFEVVNGIPYFRLKGSVIANGLGDYSHNAFYLFRVDSSGDINVTEFGRRTIGRGRGNFLRFESPQGRTIRSLQY